MYKIEGPGERLRARAVSVKRRSVLELGMVMAGPPTICPWAFTLYAALIIGRLGTKPNPDGSGLDEGGIAV
jgi:hypothetical protein